MSKAEEKRLAKAAYLAALEEQKKLLQKNELHPSEASQVPAIRIQTRGQVVTQNSQSPGRNVDNANYGNGNHPSQNKLDRNSEARDLGEAHVGILPGYVQSSAPIKSQKSGNSKLSSLLGDKDQERRTNRPQENYNDPEYLRRQQLLEQKRQQYLAREQDSSAATVIEPSDHSHPTRSNQQATNSPVVAGLDQRKSPSTHQYNDVFNIDKRISSDRIDPSKVNLSNYKKEGYPSEYAYAQAIGALDLRNDRLHPAKPYPSDGVNIPARDQTGSNGVNNRRDDRVNHEISSPVYNQQNNQFTQDLKAQYAGPQRQTNRKQDQAVPQDTRQSGGIANIGSNNDVEAKRRRQREYAEFLEAQIQQHNSQRDRHDGNKMIRPSAPPAAIISQRKQSNPDVASILEVGERDRNKDLKRIQQQAYAKELEMQMKQAEARKQHNKREIKETGPSYDPYEYNQPGRQPRDMEYDLKIDRAVYERPMEDVYDNEGINSLGKHDDKALKRAKQMEYAAFLRRQQEDQKNKQKNMNKLQELSSPMKQESNQMGEGWIMGPLGVPVRKTLDVGDRNLQKKFNQAVSTQPNQSVMQQNVRDQNRPHYNHDYEIYDSYPQNPSHRIHMDEIESVRKPIIHASQGQVGDSSSPRGVASMNTAPNAAVVGDWGSQDERDAVRRLKMMEHQRALDSQVQEQKRRQQIEKEKLEREERLMEEKMHRERKAEIDARERDALERKKRLEDERLRDLETASRRQREKNDIKNTRLQQESYDENSHGRNFKEGIKSGPTTAQTAFRDPPSPSRGPSRHMPESNIDNSSYSRHNQSNSQDTSHIRRKLRIQELQTDGRPMNYRPSSSDPIDDYSEVSSPVDDYPRFHPDDQSMNHYPAASNIDNHRNRRQMHPNRRDRSNDREKGYDYPLEDRRYGQERVNYIDNDLILRMQQETIKAYQEAALAKQELENLRRLVDDMSKPSRLDDFNDSQGALSKNETDQRNYLQAQQRLENRRKSRNNQRHNFNSNDDNQQSISVHEPQPMSRSPIDKDELFRSSKAPSPRLRPNASDGTKSIDNHRSQIGKTDREPMEDGNRIVDNVKPRLIITPRTTFDDFEVLSRLTRDMRDRNTARTKSSITLEGTLDSDSRWLFPDGRAVSDIPSPQNPSKTMSQVMVRAGDPHEKRPATTLSRNDSKSNKSLLARSGSFSFATIPSTSHDANMEGKSLKSHDTSAIPLDADRPSSKISPRNNRLLSSAGSNTFTDPTRNDGPMISPTGSGISGLSGYMKDDGIYSDDDIIQDLP